jgi:hypothetical protein
MSTDHDKFYSHLQSLPGGEDIAAAYRAYKADSFVLNGHLKVGLVLNEDLQQQFQQLQRAIIGRCQNEMTLFRMTSAEQFIAPVLPVLDDRRVIRYLGFMSTTGTPEKLHSFVPSAPETPLVLRIICPAGTFMGLMEAKKGFEEDEYLLGCGTEFEITAEPSTPPEDELVGYAGRFNLGREFKLLELRVSKNPPYAGRGSTFDF